MWWGVFLNKLKFLVFLFGCGVCPLWLDTNHIRYWQLRVPLCGETGVVRKQEQVTMAPEQPRRKRIFGDDGQSSRWAARNKLNVWDTTDIPVYFLFARHGYRCGLHARRRTDKTPAP